MLSTIAQAIALAIVKYFAGRAEFFIERLIVVSGLKKKYENIQKKADEAIDLLKQYESKINNNEQLTPEEKDKLSEDIADAIADRLRNM